MTKLQLRKFIKIFDGGRSVRIDFVNKALTGKKRINDKALSEVRFQLNQIGYKLIQYTADCPYCESLKYARHVTRYRLYRYRRDDCWPCGYQKDSLKTCWHWQQCCNGHPDRGDLRCELAVEMEEKELHKSDGVPKV